MSERGALLGANVVSLSVCYQQLSARINAVLEPHKLNMTQLSILTHFCRLPEGHAETITQLSKAMQMNQPMVTKAVSAMHKQGFFDKRPGREDGRVSYLCITDAGRRCLQAAQLACMPLIEGVYADLDELELGQLMHLLTKVQNRLS